MGKTDVKMLSTAGGPETPGDIVKRIKKSNKKKALKTVATPDKAGVAKKKRRKKRKVVDVVLKTSIPKPSANVKTEANSAKKPVGVNNQLGIVTRAGIRRCATRVGIRCIQRDTVDFLKDTVEEVTKELLLRARSNAYNISRTKTLRLVDIASASRIMGLGDVVA